jgi:hypothetical protein
MWVLLRPLTGLNLNSELGPKGFKVTKFHSRHRLEAHSVRRSLFVTVCQETKISIVSSPKSPGVWQWEE